jgi:hypothetical protein
VYTPRGPLLKNLSRSPLEENPVTPSGHNPKKHSKWRGLIVIDNAKNQAPDIKNTKFSYSLFHCVLNARQINIKRLEHVAAAWLQSPV